MLYLDLGYSDLFVIITIVFSCQYTAQPCISFVIVGKKTITKSSFRRNQLCRINCICFFARPQEQIKLES